MSAPLASPQDSEDATSNCPSYYQDLGDDADFKDFDDRDEYYNILRKARSSRTGNFVLDFGPKQAYCALDVSAPAVAQLLDRSRTRPAECDTRWIQIWGPHRQTEIIRLLAQRYGFTPRLAGLMCASPRKSRLPHSRPASRRSDKVSTHNVPLSPRFNRWSTRHDQLKPQDPEKTANVHVMRTDPQGDMLNSLNHYDIVQSIYHWSSVDPGENNFCLGYNTLQIVGDKSYKQKGKQAQREKSAGNRKWKATNYSDLPDGKRVWNWLILCDDKTVISLTEDADALPASEVDVAAVRRNMLNVLSQLSAVSDPSSQNPISLVPIRRNVSGTAMDDGPGLLFYYLFDDWYSSFSLVAGHEHRYGARLRELREEMLEKADLEHINELHHIGRQLSCLQRLYHSYKNIIDRLLSRHLSPAIAQRGGAAMRPFSHPIARDELIQRAAAHADPGDQLGVYLTSAARVRFERLRDRIGLYALSEIDECIKMMDSLVSMNFSLIGMRESTYVEKLTRITILLSKATLLFLPVSLLTAYGSLPDSNVSVKAYWIAFAVLLAVTFMLILAFGVLTQTLEGSLLYVSIWDQIWAFFTGVKHVGERVVGHEDEDEHDEKQRVD